MAGIKDFSWVGEITLTRRQVVSLGLLADLTPNLISTLKKDFPISLRDVSEEAIREAFHEFRRLYLLDKDCYQKIHEVAQSLNKK